MRQKSNRRSQQSSIYLGVDTSPAKLNCQDMSTEPNKTFRIYAAMASLCCITHLMTHLGAARFERLNWWLAISIVLAACWTLHRFSLQKFFLLIGLQMAHVMVDAPFNPDHWLLVFLVNVIITVSAADLWLRGQTISEQTLYERFAPAARLTFLICYGFAAFSKLNTHFIVADSSCARELADIQIAVSPWLSRVSVPTLAGWMTVLCESSVALLLIPRRTRRYGILVGVVFHTILVISPAIAVFDFSMTVYTMLFLFAGANVGDELSKKVDAFTKEAPAIPELATTLLTPILIAIAGFMIGRSAMGYPLYGDPTLTRLNWLCNMPIAATVIYCTITLLFGKNAISPSATFRPRMALHAIVLALAVFNGLCPYLGLKTQGSFTMFSNLRTEAGHWNHLIVPASVRLIDGYQDDLVEIKEVNDKRLTLDFVNRDCLTPRFEVQRAATKNPDLAITIIRDGEEIQLNPISVDSKLGEPVNWLVQKLLVFRPVTPDGSPYCGN